jgi:hypothetical protein
MKHMTKLAILHFVHSDINHRTLILYKALPNKMPEKCVKMGVSQKS